MWCTAGQRAKRTICIRSTSLSLDEIRKIERARKLYNTAAIHNTVLFYATGNFTTLANLLFPDNALDSTAR